MRLDEYNYAGATAIAVVLLAISFVLLALINGLEAWAAKFSR
jgi:sulfate transport system permease protein